MSTTYIIIIVVVVLVVLGVILALVFSPRNVPSNSKINLDLSMAAR